MAATEVRSWRWPGLAALVLATLFLLCGAAAAWFAFRGMLGPDFVSYWAAGHLAAAGDAGSAYDMARHHAVEAEAIRNPGQLPFAYPPSFLLFLLPFGMLPFRIAFALWIAITVALYLLATRRVLDARYGLAQAGAAANLVIGQNGFLTAAIFVQGTELLRSRPFIAGAILGLLSIKPQLAVLVPVALLAGREWRALAGAALSCAALLGLAFALFGTSAFTGFISMVAESSRWLNDSRWHWSELASPFALFRSLGLGYAPALIAHGAIAIAAAAVTVRAWASHAKERVPILAASSLLISPYLFTYDGLLLTLPLAWALRHRRPAFLGIWLLSLLPLAGYFGPVPNTLPIAAMLALWALHWPGKEPADA